MEKDSTGASSFSKSVPEEEWYMAATPGTPLMELAPYSSSPYGISDTRSSFNQFGSSLNLDTTHTLLNNFRTAPLTLGMDGGSRILDEITCSGGQGSGDGFLSDDGGKDDDEDLDDSGDGSEGPYEVEEGAGNGLDNHPKGKGKKGLPAKNLMAERRRRKKLNDRLYMLRSVVPKITKMDRASILGDAIDYVKELRQRINDLENVLEAANLEHSRSPRTSPPGVLIPMSTQGGYSIIKEECPVLPNPEYQPPQVEVRKRDGHPLNIHMFCARRPGLLLSTVRALDALGLDVQQAVISCFNGFALDLFRAEQANGMEVGPDEIKAVLLFTAECGMHLQ